MLKLQEGRGLSGSPLFAQGLGQCQEEQALNRDVLVE